MGLFSGLIPAVATASLLCGQVGAPRFTASASRTPTPCILTRERQKNIVLQLSHLCSVDLCRGVRAARPACVYARCSHTQLPAVRHADREVL